MSKKEAASLAVHELAVKLANDVLQAREPVSSAVLAWGWLLKQGEGGFLHGETFKARWFVLARVPHATVLIYYDRKCMDEDHILGYIDMRRVIAVREGSRTVTFDGSRSYTSALMHKMRGFMMMGGGGGGGDSGLKPVLELVTSSRTYTLCPCTAECPAPVSMAASIGVSFYGKPLYLFGWPFPVPHLEGASTSSSEEDDGGDDNTSASDAEALTAAQAMMDSNESAGWSLDIFGTWQQRLREVVLQEKSSRVFPVVLVVDSTGTLPPKLLLRVTPSEIAFVSVDDKDLCYTAIPHNDLVKWDVQAETELKVQARTRSRLVARPDRTGFTSQRPTRTTQHFVFKSTAARTIAMCIDNQVKATGAELGEDVGGFSPSQAEDDEAYSAARADAAEPEEAESKATIKAKLTRHQSARPQPAPMQADEGDGDEEEEEMPLAKKGAGATSKAPAAPAPAPAPTSSRSSASASAPASGSSVAAAKGKAKPADDSEDEPAPKPKAAAPVASPKAAAPAPAPAPVAKGKKAAADSDDDDDDRPSAASPKKSAAPAPAPAAAPAEDADDTAKKEKEKKSKAKAAAAAAAAAAASAAAAAAAAEAEAAAAAAVAEAEAEAAAAGKPKKAKKKKAVE